MKIINEISLGVWFETNEDTWIIPRVKLMSMCIKGVNVEDDDSYMDNYVSPLSTQMTPNIIGEKEVDDVHANRNDHDEGELINIV